jgi:hypothetical protein
VIDEDCRNDGNGKKDEVDEEFYCYLLFDERNESEENSPESAEEDAEDSLGEKKNVVIDGTAVVPKGVP